MTTQAPSFFSTVPEGSTAEELLLEYEQFLLARNGKLSLATGFEQRDAMMADFAAMPGQYEGVVDVDRIQRAYGGDGSRELTEAEIALLTFVKINAGEAYGVEVTTAARAHLHDRDEPIFRVERVLAHEETYHTRMLLGITQHFGDLDLGDGWRPPRPLKTLIYALAKSPPALFHPILLGAEVAGVFLFNWLLERTHTLFPDHPEVRESMERRLIEILIDEVGHIAYNRIAVRNVGVRLARPLAGQVIKGQDVMNPEIISLGLDDDARSTLARFDYGRLPQEVRQRAFFA